MNSKSTWQPNPALIERLHPTLREHAVQLPPDPADLTPEHVAAMFPNIQALGRLHREMERRRAFAEQATDSDVPETA